MASEEDSFANAASKKRVASRQISKDDDPDVEEETSLEGDTFRKAPDSVLANRRIVKVRRTGSNAAAPPAAVNPFASIRLIPPAAAQPTPTEPSPAAAEPTPATEPTPTTEPIPTEPTPAESQPEVSSDVQAGEDKSKEVIAPPESATEAVAVTVTETTTETASRIADESPKVTTVNNEKVVDTKAVTNGSSTAVVGATVPSSETFQQASSAKNAFSASFGTGFPTTTFGSNQSTSGGFGALNGGFSFGSGSTFGSSLFGSANPALNPVFEKTNGSNTFQLPATTSPAAPSSTTKITLQEVPLETGEEKEKAVFTADASLFEFLDGGWKERGKGEIKVSVPEDVQRKSRLVMRSKGNLRLLLNANIFPDMKITKMDNRGVTFVCANATAGGKEGFTTYALKLRDPQIAKDFMSTVEAHKGTATSTD